MQNIFDVVNDLDLTTVVVVGTLVILLLGACVFTKIEEVEGELKCLQNLHQQGPAYLSKTKISDDSIIAAPISNDAKIPHGSWCAHLHTGDPHK